MSIRETAAVSRGRSVWTPGMARRVDRALTVYVPLLIMLFFLLAPFYWMLITSLKPDSELYSPNGNPLLVFSPSLEHYQKLLTGTEFPTWTRNTMAVAAWRAGFVSPVLSSSPGPGRSTSTESAYCRGPGTGLR